MVEDHPEYRSGVELALDTEDDIKLRSTFSTAEGALQRLQDPSAQCCPDVLLLDLHLPGISGLEAIRWIKEYSPKTKIIVLTQSDHEADVMRAIESGASGYLLKSSTLTQITDAIRTATNGGATIDPKMATYILDTLRKQPTKQHNSGISLTKREMEVLELLSQGLLKKQISDQLGISTPTVSTHVSHIYEKLEVQNAPAAITTAFKAGILPVRP